MSSPTRRKSRPDNKAGRYTQRDGPAWFVLQQLPPSLSSPPPSPPPSLSQKAPNSPPVKNNSQLSSTTLPSIQSSSKSSPRVSVSSPPSKIIPISSGLRKQTPENAETTTLPKLSSNVISQRAISNMSPSLDPSISSVSSVSSISSSLSPSFSAPSSSSFSSPSLFITEVDLDDSNPPLLLSSPSIPANNSFSPVPSFSPSLSPAPSFSPSISPTPSFSHSPSISPAPSFSHSLPSLTNDSLLATTVTSDISELGEDEEKIRMYRLCFWPFYVWRRSLRQKKAIIYKGQFLARVFYTFVMLRVFRQWVRFTKETKIKSLKFSAHRQVMSHNQVCQTFKKWTLFVNKQRRIRHITALPLLQRMRPLIGSTALSLIYLLKWNNRWAKEVKRRKYSQLPRMSEYAVPTLSICSFADSCPPISGLFKHYTQKDIKTRQAMRFLFRRVGAKFFQICKEYSLYKKKSRFASVKGNTLLMRRYLGAWREYIVQQRIKKREKEGNTNNNELVNLMRKAKERRERAEQKKANEQMTRVQQAAARKVLGITLERKRAELRALMYELADSSRKFKNREARYDLEVSLFLKGVDREQKEARRDELREYKKRITKVRQTLLDDLKDRITKREEQKRKKTVFKILMKPILVKRSKAFAARHEVKSAIRSLYTIRKILRKSVIYARLYFLWRAWVAWRAFVLEARRWQTPNLHRNIRLRSHLLLSYSKRLERGARPSHYDLKGTFLRWTEYTQKCVRYKKIVQLFREKSAWKISRVFFRQLKADALIGDDIVSIRSIERDKSEALLSRKAWRVVPAAPIEEKLSEALEQWSVVLYKEYFTHRKFLMKYYDNQRIHNLAVELGRASMKYFEHTSLQVRKRISIEASLLTTKLREMGHMSPHILAVLKLRKAELLFHFDTCLSFALRVRRITDPELAPLTTARISSGLAAWLFSLRSFGLVPLPRSRKQKDKAKERKEGEENETTKEENTEKEKEKEKAELPDTLAFKKHLQFLNRFVFSKKQQHRTYNKVGEERKKSSEKK